MKNIYGKFLLTLLLTSSVVFAQNASQSTGNESEAVSPADAALQEEILKRQEDIFVLNNLIDEGYKFLEAKTYPKAQERFDEVIRKTDSRGATAPINEKAKAGRAKIAAIQAADAENKGDLNTAGRYWQEAVNYAPNNKEYNTALAKIKEKNKPLSESYGGNTAATPELKSKIDKVNELIEAGRKHFDVGRYNEAKSYFEEVLRIDPYNKVAFQEINKIEKAKFVANTARMKSSREEALANVERQWADKVLPKKKDDTSIKVSGSVATKTTDIYRKLETIKISELNFTDVEISQAVLFLVDQSRKLDPDKKGVNIVLKLHSTGAGKAGDTGAPVIPNVSFSLRDVPLGDVLEIIHQTTGLQIKVEDNAVFILPANDVGGVMLVKSFTVTPTFFESGTGGGGKPNTPFVDSKQQLINKGVQFPDGASASYFQATSRLVVRGTPEMLNQIEQLVNLERGKELPQVEIESKFVQFNETQMNELRFRWQVGVNDTMPSDSVFAQSDGNSTSYVPRLLGSVAHSSVGGATGGLRGINADNISPQAGISGETIDGLLITGSTASAITPSTMTLGGIFDGNAVQLLISAMNYVAGNDVVSAPKLTLRQGSKGTIRSSREFVYPSTYEAPQVTSGENASITPSNPETWNFDNPKDVGVKMVVEVKGINADSRLIDLEMPSIEVTDFDGFINYGGDVTSEFSDFILIRGVAFQPVFSVRRVSTSVQLRDGQGLVMGGLMRDDVQEVNDKVPLFGDLPLVGRLFRSKSKKSTKKNLMIVTTARLIGSDGKSLYPSDASYTEGINTAASR